MIIVIMYEVIEHINMPEYYFGYLNVYQYGDMTKISSVDF